MEKKKKSKKKEYIISICTSHKACGEQYGKYNWERVCNEYEKPLDTEEFEISGITYKKSPCQGNCKRMSSVQSREKNNPKKEPRQFSYITPLKVAKLVKSLNSGANPNEIKKL